MKSFSLQGMKRHPSLIPLVVIVGIGGLGAAWYTARLALRNPDVRANAGEEITSPGKSWNKKTNPEPWQEWSNKQYKLWSTKDYSDLPKPERPEF